MLRMAACAWLSIGLALLIPSGKPAIVAASTDTFSLPPATRISHSTASDAPTFRRGSAARPFDWSGRFVYRVECSIRGRLAYELKVESSHSALTISAMDVDGEKNLDIITSTPFTARTVRIGGARALLSVLVSRSASP